MYRPLEILLSQLLGRHQARSGHRGISVFTKWRHRSAGVRQGTSFLTLAAPEQVESRTLMAVDATLDSGVLYINFSGGTNLSAYVRVIQDPLSGVNQVQFANSTTGFSFSSNSFVASNVNEVRVLDTDNNAA